MPIYEFVCESCGAPFEELTRSHTAIAEVRCPHCGSDRLRRKISTFSSRVAGNTHSSSTATSCSVGGT